MILIKIPIQSNPKCISNRPHHGLLHRTLLQYINYFGTHLLVHFWNICNHLLFVTSNPQHSDGLLIHPTGRTGQWCRAGVHRHLWQASHVGAGIITSDQGRTGQHCRGGIKYHLLRILLRNLISGEIWAEIVGGGVSAYIYIQVSTEKAGQLQSKDNSQHWFPDVRWSLHWQMCCKWFDSRESKQ